MKPLNPYRGLGCVVVIASALLVAKLLLGLAAIARGCSL